MKNKVAAAVVAASGSDERQTAAKGSAQHYCEVFFFLSYHRCLNSYRLFAEQVTLSGTQENTLFSSKTTKILVNQQFTSVF